MQLLFKLLITSLFSIIESLYTTLVGVLILLSIALIDFFLCHYYFKDPKSFECRIFNYGVLILIWMYGSTIPDCDPTPFQLEYNQSTVLSLFLFIITGIIVNELERQKIVFQEEPPVSLRIKSIRLIIVFIFYVFYVYYYGRLY
jgi:hypothetical protein